MALLQLLEFASCDVYAPQGRNPISEQSKRRTSALKTGKDYAIAHYAGRAVRLARQGEFPGFFGARVTLVPVCRSSPVVVGGLWVPMLLAQAMQRLGMGREATPLLKRVSAVSKSAFVRPEDRPSAQQHLASMQADVLSPPPTNIVLVDDVVTRGTTLLAAASRIAQAYPEAEIRAFALVRTMSRQDIDAMEAPCTGTIRPHGTWAQRDP